MLKPIMLSSTDRIDVDVTDDLRFFTFRTYAIADDGTYTSPSFNASLRNISNRFIEYKYISTGLCAPTTDLVSLQLKTMFPSDQMLLSDPAKQMLDFRLSTYIRQAKCAKLQADSKNRLPFTAREFNARPGVEYMLHQKYAAECAIGNPSYAYFMEQGTGKTLTTIMRIDVDCLIKPEPYRVLVICPGAVRVNWKSELRTFSTTRGDIFTLRGSKLGRQKRLLDSLRSKDVDWVTCIISYDSAVMTLASLSVMEWDLIVTDESHYFKGSNTSRSKAVMKLRDSAKARMALTGSPIVNGPADLYAQLEFLGEGCSGFSGGKKFKAFYHKYKQVSDNHSIFLGAQNVPLLQERLAGHSFLVTQKEALPDLPSLSYSVQEVEMTEAQKKLYAQIASQLRTEIEGELEDSTNYAVTVNHVLTRMLRLAQITSGFVKCDPVYDLENGTILEEGSIDRIDPNPKLEAMIEFIKASKPEDKHIIWACWVQDIKTITSRLELEGIKCVQYYGAVKQDDREAAILSFNTDNETRVFVGNQECAGIGVNLLGQSSALHDAVWMHFFSQRWFPAVRGQGEKRFHRKGTRRQVCVMDWVIPESIDEEIRARVMDKRNMATKIQDIRALLTEVTKCLDK